MKKIFLVLLVFILFGISLVYFFVYTTKGTNIFFRYAINDYVSQDTLDVGQESGSLAEGFLLENIELVDIKDLPAGSKIRIQRLFINLTSLSPDGLLVEVENARVLLPDSAPIIISGTLKSQILDFNIFSSSFGVNEVVSYLPDFKSLIPVKGEVAEIDLYIKDHFLEPRVSGDFRIKEFLYKGFALEDTPINIDIQLKNVRSDVQLFGKVTIRDGILQAKKSRIDRINGSLNFNGAWSQPSLYLSGHSKVKKTKIAINLKGSLDKPDLSLTSEPPYSRQKLMVMLATGKNWQSLEGAIDSGVVSSADVTKDFIDYYFFAGKTNRFAEKLGLHDVFIKLEKDTQGIEGKKEITDKFNVGYGIEQQSNGVQEKTTKQTIQGEYQVTDKLSVGVEREVKETQNLDELNLEEDKVNDDKVYLKYKRSF